jgi:diguanylate cyclase (GGDEF)-like protein
MPDPAQVPAEGIEDSDTDAEVASLLHTLLETDRRLDELTAGQVDSFTDKSGRLFLLQRSQQQLLHGHAGKQNAILNALPAHIVLLDARGFIKSINESWRRSVTASALLHPDCEIGANYLTICESSAAAGAAEAAQVTAQIRSVLDGTAGSFSMEYAWKSPTEQRWFLLTVTPFNEHQPSGAVVMHLDITERKESEIRIAHLNRIYAMLSGVNTLIVRVRDREELFRETCRITVEAGGFAMAWIGLVDRGQEKIIPVARAGLDDDYVAAISGVLWLNTAAGKHSMSVRAVNEKRVILSNNTQYDANVLFGTEHARKGINSIATFPLIVSGEAVGVLVVYAVEAEFFHGDEVRCLTELAGDVSFAIDHIEERERLSYLAYYDVLTGLANRDLFLERVALHLRRAESEGHQSAIYLIDVERFKNFNHSLGRIGGDALLRQVAKWLAAHAGDPSMVARVDADHFAVVIPEVARVDEVAKSLESTLEALRAHPFDVSDTSYRISAKIGVAMFPDDGADADILFKNAETALKRAKLSGDPVLFFAARMTETVTGRLSLENQLRNALDRREFVLHYQPKVTLASGKLAGAEALIRWNDPQTGLVPPGRFIPILEETGLIHEVGRWALNQALEDYLRWRNAGLPAVRIAVNVSPLQLRSRNFVAELRQTMALDAHAMEGLGLEITESVIMGDVEDTMRRLREIREMGIRIAIDDFGTGFSSLSYLSKLPIDTLKIDRSFVVDMVTGPAQMSLISIIINMAHTLQLDVVAEGVETQEQSRLLHLLRCDEIQGFLLSKPLPEASFVEKFLVAPTPPLQSA